MRYIIPIPAREKQSSRIAAFTMNHPADERFAVYGIRLAEAGLSRKNSFRIRLAGMFGQRSFQGPG